MSEQPREVFISYHTDTGGDAVRKICTALEGAGISCWYAPRDVGPNYAHSIVEAIRGCRVFLLVLNEKSNVSAHVLNEINCAFDRFKDHEDITLLPFRIDQCSLSDDIYYYLGRIHIMDGVLPPELLRIQELVDRVSRLLGREASRDISLPASAVEGGTVHYRIIGSRVYPDSHFTGREEELSAIHEQLNGAENKVFLVGMGGIGKSEIVRMYLKRYDQEYDVVLWLSFEESLRRILLSDAAFPIEGLNRIDFPEDSDEDYFWRKLRILKKIADKRVLVVVDNFDVPDDPDLEAFTSGEYSVIFTTRCHQDSGRLPEIEIGPVTEHDQLLAMFRSEYVRALDEKGTAWVDEILAQLDGHPLSIRLVASTMQSRRIPPEKMDALLKEGAASMARQNAKAADLIFGRLRQVFQLSTLSGEEQYLLKNLSLISLQGIPVETLFDWCALEDFELIDDLIRRSWVLHDPVNDTVHLHPLVSDLMAEELEKDPMCCEKLVDSLSKACGHQGQLGTSYEHKQWLLGLANTASFRLPDDHPLKPILLKGQGEINQTLSQYQEALDVFRTMLDLPLDLPMRIFAYNRLAHNYWHCGDPERCVRIAQEGMALAETASPKEMDAIVCEYSELMNRITEGNRDMGRYDEALANAQLAVEYCERMKEHFSPSAKGWRYYHLGRVLQEMGRLNESEDCLSTALSLYDEDGDEWSKSFAYGLLGIVRKEQGRYEEALDQNAKFRDILLPQLGPEHADVGTSLVWRGDIYRAMGDSGKAAGCYAQAADIFRKRNCFFELAQVQALAEQK